MKKKDKENKVTPAAEEQAPETVETQQAEQEGAQFPENFTNDCFHDHLSFAFEQKNREAFPSLPVSPLIESPSVHADRGRRIESDEKRAQENMHIQACMYIIRVLIFLAFIMPFGFLYPINLMGLFVYTSNRRICQARICACVLPGRSFARPV